MVERKLSAADKRIFISLSKERREIEASFRELVEAEQNQLELLREHYGLPEGEYQLRVEDDGSLVMFREDREDGDKPD